MASNFPLIRGRELAEMAMSKNLKQSKYPVREKLRIQLFEPPDAEVFDDPYGVCSEPDQSMNETVEEKLCKSVMIALTPTKERYNKEDIVNEYARTKNLFKTCEEERRREGY